MEQEAFVEFVSLHIRIFKILGYWKPNPDEENHSLYNFYTILCTVIWLLCLTSQIVHLVMVFDDMQEFTEIVYLSGIFLIIFLRTVTIYHKLDSIKICMMELDKPLMQPKCQRHFELSRALRSFHKKCYFFFIFMAFQITAGFAVIPFIVEGRPTVYQGWFPFDWKKSPFYEIVLTKNVEYIYRVTICILFFCAALILCSHLYQLTQSDKILFSAYNTPWVECNTKFKKTLLNFMTHTSKPIGIKAGGLFTMSNSVFISIARRQSKQSTLCKLTQNWGCLETLNALGSQNRLTLAWVPAHTGYEGNEEADSLARAGANKALNGPEPFCGIAKAIQKTSIKSWMQTESQEWWNNSPGMRQAKEFIKKPSPTFTEYLLSQKRSSTRILLGLLTGHCRLNKHMSTIGLTEELLCRFCQEKEETAVHILCHCEGLSRLRFLTLSEEKPGTQRSES
ncbi:unnamed protein product [Phaedon cochleariae]|uniref:Odorant receptor n=1 Tax=Phaedon cochleariae TaxID=80249 RepID=A0A9N9SI25_PHACE|nr:unnamed protein product [Phaedon cochleariae]